MSISEYLLQQQPSVNSIQFVEYLAIIDTVF